MSKEIEYRCDGPGCDRSNRAPLHWLKLEWNNKTYDFHTWQCLRGWFIEFNSKQEW